MASKKWKKRLKKIGKVAAIAGAAALAAKLASKRGRAGEMSGLTTVPDSQKEGFTSRYITKKTIPDILPEAKVVSPAVTTGGSYLSRMGGAGNRATQIANQKKRANLAQRGRIINPHEATAAAGAAYNPHQVIRGRINRNVVYKHGGRVTGIAKRGFGRALMKGKK